MTKEGQFGYGSTGSSPPWEPAASLRPDIRIENHFSLVILYPLTDAGRDWIYDNVDPDAQRWCGGIVVEPRYVANIVNGAIEDGLVAR